MRKFFLVPTILSLCMMLPFSAAAERIRFGVPPWPGVTVKTEVVCQILHVMGYDTEQLEVGPPVIFRGLTTGDVDAYVGVWIPLQNEMFQPLKEKGAIDVIGTNLDESGSSLCVPAYVWNAGVHSIGDLDKYADKFDHTIYGIEPGTGMNTTTDELIKRDVAGLGDWTQVGSTTPVMLSAVMDRVKQKKWVVFHGWRPHWMNVKIDMKFLDGVSGTENLVSTGVVYTIASNDFEKRFPEARAFLRRLYVKGATQSEWINDFAYEKQPAEKVAHAWIAGNLDTVASWLEGVRTVDGGSAIDAVRAAYE